MSRSLIPPVGRASVDSFSSLTVSANRGASSAADRFNDLYASALPEDAVRLTFVETPKFHVGVRLLALKSRLENSNRTEVLGDFEVKCKHRQSLIRIHAVDGFSAQTSADDMWLGL